MPILEKPSGYEKLIGSGMEKDVYGKSEEEKGEESMVVKETRNFFKEYRRSPNYVKAPYYITKIAHLLMPKNIPDIHFAGIKDKTKITVEQRMYADQTREAIVQTKNQDSLDEVGELVGKFNEWGYIFDKSYLNFDYDYDKNIVYFDSFEPWEKDKNSGDIAIKLNESALQSAIDQLPDQRKKEEANHFLQRIKVLFNEELEERKNKK